MNEADVNFDKMLSAAYEYYWGYGETNLADWEYDALTKKVYEQRDQITDPRKSFVDFDSLKNCSSLFYLSRDAYGKETS